MPIVHILIIHDLDEAPFHQGFQRVVDRGQADSRVFLLSFLENLPRAGMGLCGTEDLQNRLPLLSDPKTRDPKRFSHFFFYSTDLYSPRSVLILIRTVLNKIVNKNFSYFVRFYVRLTKWGTPVGKRLVRSTLQNPDLWNIPCYSMGEGLGAIETLFSAQCTHDFVY